MEKTKKIPTYSEILKREEQRRPKLSIFYNPTVERKSSIALDHMQNVKLKELQKANKDIFERVMEREEDQLKAFISNFIRNNKDEMLIRPRKKELVQDQENSITSLKTPTRAPKIKKKSTIYMLANNFVELDSDRSLQNFDNVDDSLSDLADELLKEEMESGSFFIDPKSQFYEIWNKIIFLSSVYIFAMNPVILAFNIALSTFLLTMEIVIDVVFVVDLVLHFFLAFPDKSGEVLITKLKLIVINYLTGNFALDLLSSMPFSVILLASDYQRVLSGANKWRALMYLKMSRLLRLRTIFDFSNVTFLSKMLTKTPFISVASHEMGFKIKRFVKWFLLFVVISHNLSCLWIFVAEFSAASWTSSFEEYSNTDLYIVSLYYNWLSIFSVGYGDITPTNKIEQIYTILMLSLGILVYSIFITSLGSILSSQDYKQLKYHKRLEQLKKIRSKYKLSQELYKKILKQVNFASIMNKYDGFNFIEDLPVKLRTELILQMNKEIIVNFKFFRGKPLSFVTAIVVKFKFQRTFKGDSVISEGDIVQDMVFIKEGKLLVSLGKQYNNLKVYELRKFEYFGDVLMLANQRSPINLSCSYLYSDLLYLKKEDLEAAMDEYPLLFSKINEGSASGYAKLLAKIEAKIIKAEKRENKVLRKNLEFINLSKKMVDLGQKERKSTGQDLIKRVMRNSESSFTQGKTTFLSNSASNFTQKEKDSLILKGTSFVEPSVEIYNRFSNKERSAMIKRELTQVAKTKEKALKSPVKYFTKNIKSFAGGAVEETNGLIARLDKIMNGFERKN